MKRLSARVHKQKTAYHLRWAAQHRAEAAVMVPKGWRWSVGGGYWVPAK